MTGPEAARTLELVQSAERAVVRLLLAMGEPVPHVGAASYYAVCTAAKLEAVVDRAVERILEANHAEATAGETASEARRVGHLRPAGEVACAAGLDEAGA